MSDCIGTGCKAEVMMAQISRLRSALDKANSQTEQFEREWYLRGDELERLCAEVEAMRADARDRCVRAIESVPSHVWVDGSDYHGNPCPAKVLATKANYIAAVRAAMQDPKG